MRHLSPPHELNIQRELHAARLAGTQRRLELGHPENPRRELSQLLARRLEDPRFDHLSVFADYGDTLSVPD